MSDRTATSHYTHVGYRRNTVPYSETASCSCVRLAARLGLRFDVAYVEQLTPEEVGELSAAAFIGPNPDVSVCPHCDWGYVIIPASRVVHDVAPL